MTSGAPRLTVVVPVRNDAARLARCFESVARNGPSAGEVEVIVADNGSTDESAAVARQAGAHVLVLPDLRVAELRNRAAALAGGSAMAFIDADHEIGPRWIQDALEALQGDRVGAAGALYTAPPNGTWVQRLYGALRGVTTGRHDVAWLGSGNLIVRREAFEAVGGFDASLVACEDVDFCRRLRAAGWRIVADERLASVHHGDPATLGALFRAERWRGRDNIRVTLRGPLAPRDLPSVLVPIVELVLGLGAVAGTVATPFLPGAWLFAVACVTAIAVLVILRAVRIVRRLSRPTGIDLFRAWMVAATYDAARALALVTRAPHHRRSATGSATTRAPIT